MFNQLIESSSHKKELKRRGSFLAFTTVTYVMLFAITGVVSIYAYDNHLQEQNLEPVLVMRPYEFSEPVVRPIAYPGGLDAGHPRGPSNGSDKAQTATSLDHPNVVPEEISAEVFKGVALPPGPKTRSNDKLGADGVGRLGNGGEVPLTKQPTEILPDELPPTPTPTPVKIVKSTTIVNSLATYLPKPNYPPMAKNIHVQGSVNVQVLIDESGKVISAKALSGHPLLIAESVRAATNARFSPTTLNGVAVKLSGVIVYNFVMQ